MRPVRKEYDLSQKSTCLENYIVQFFFIAQVCRIKMTQLLATAAGKWITNSTRLCSQEFCSERNIWCVFGFV